MFACCLLQKQAGNRDAEKQAELQQQHTLHLLQQSLQVSFTHVIIYEAYHLTSSIDRQRSKHMEDSEWHVFG